MTDAPSALLSRFRGREVLIDTNILLLYFVGSFNPSLIETFKRTRTAGFTAEDFELLVRCLQRFRSIVTTPNILTEVSNFISQIGEPYRTGVRPFFAQAVRLITEQYVTSGEATEHPAFVRFGLTDAVIKRIAEGEVLVLTDDFRLAQYLQSSGLHVVNFNHLRKWS
jgi:hypothetical protein